MILEKTLESPLDCKEIKPVNLKGNQPWIFIGRTDAEAEAPILSCEELTHWKRPSFWKRSKAGEGDYRGWDGWMDMSFEWAPGLVMDWEAGVLHSVGSQRAGYDWVTELNWQIQRPGQLSRLQILSLPLLFRKKLFALPYLEIGEQSQKLCYIRAIIKS